MSQVSYENKPRFMFWAGASLSGLGVLVLIAVLTSYLETSATAKWPTVQGTVVVSELLSRQETREFRGSDPDRRVKEKVTVYEPHLRYAYTVDGREFTGTRIAFYPGSTTDETVAREEIDRYPVGAQVTVFYDPRDPAESLLESGAAPGLILMLVVGIILCAAGLCVLASWKKELRKRKSEAASPSSTA